MQTRLIRLAVSSSLWWACAGAQPSPPSPADPSAPNSSASNVTTPRAAPAPTLTPTTVSASGDRSPSCTALPRYDKHTFTRILEQRVTSIGVGEAGRAAVYAPGQATLFDGMATSALAVPGLPPDASVRIFFGRDNQPRLMGFGAGTGGGVRSVYWRYRHGRFQPEPSELGPLGSPHGALYGVLGFEDPEVVCRPGVTCLVKRLTGWGRAPAHTQPTPIVLSNGEVFALHEDRVERLKKDAWVPLEPARSFRSPVDAWQEPNGALFVAEGDALVRLAGGVWTELPAPLGAVSAVLGRTASDLFVAGAIGAAHYDGTTFRCIRDVPGPLTAIARVGADVWIAGDTGVYRTSPGP